MLAAYAVSQSSTDPLSGLVIDQRPDPVIRPGWSVVKLRAAGLNHHDVWSLLGVGLPAERLPIILGCDGAGVDDAGNEVIIHAVVPSDGWTGDETLDPARTLLSELYDGTLAEYVAVPVQRRPLQLVDRPGQIRFVTRAVADLDAVVVTTDLGLALATTPEQTVLDLCRADPREEDVDARAAIDTLWSECDQAVLGEIAGRQRMRATLTRLRAAR